MGHQQKCNTMGVVGYFSELENQNFPIDVVWKANGHSTKLSIVDSRNAYIPPPEIAQKAEEILSTYQDSTVFNNECIRLKDYDITENELVLYTERTQYFYSLITNRRMDYVLGHNLRIRDIYEPGQKLSALIDSQMSNHIGFSVLIKTTDQRLVFAIRNKKVSTKKNLLDCGVSGSLKAKYALSPVGVLTVEGFFDAVAKEIVDELHLPPTNTVSITADSMIALYRDRIEGGKPNLVFFCNIDYSSKELHSFIGDKDDEMVMDLDHLFIIEQSVFLNTEIRPEAIRFRFDESICEMPLSPNTSGVFAFLKKYITKKMREKANMHTHDLCDDEAVLIPLQ